MFDAKNLFEMMVRGGDPSARQAPTGQAEGHGGGTMDLSDLLRQFTDGGGQRQAGQTGAGGQVPSGQSGGGLEDLLRQFTQGRGGDGQQGGGGLEDLLRQFTGDRDQNTDRTAERQMPNAAPGAGSGPGAGGGLGDLLGQVFGQGGGPAPGGSGQGGPAVGQLPGQGGARSEDVPAGLRELLEKIGGSGAASGDLVRQLSDFIGNNKVGAGAALGGLGALIFGTQTGRSVAMSAAKIGALAVVGGLAYKAYQNYSQGSAPATSQSITPEAAPQGTGFEAEQVSNDAAVTYIRGMIAATAADGRIDSTEQEQIIGALKGQGLGDAAEEFLANELNNPASIDELVSGVSNQTESLQLYTAARVAIEPDTGAEQQFLNVLADRLGITPDLRAHVDAAARGMA